MSIEPTVAEVRTAGEFELVTDAFLTERIADAVEDVADKLREQTLRDDSFTISDRRRAALVKWRACELAAVTERRLQTESGDGLSGQYQGSEGQFRREFDRAWSRALGGKSAYTSGDV